MKLKALHEQDDIEMGPEIEGPGPGPGPEGPETGIGLEEPPRGSLPPTGYNVQQAKAQLDGILKRWMDMAGGFPEGEQRHRFIEIGERLEEIANTLERDFVQGEAESPI